MTDIRLIIAPDLIHCGVPQRLSDAIILNNKPKISLLSYFKTLFFDDNIIKAPTINSVQNSVNIYVKFTLLIRLYDRLLPVDTSTLPYITQLKGYLHDFLHNVTQPLFQKSLTNELNEYYIGITTFGLSLFANARSDAEEIEKVQIETLTEGNLTLKPISADGLETVLDDSYINAVSQVIGYDISKLIEKCSKEVPAQLGILTNEVRIMLSNKQLRMDGGYDYNCPSSTTDITHYGGFDSYIHKRFDKLTRFYNLNLAIVPLSKLRSVHLFEKELEVLDSDKSLFDQVWSGVASFVEKRQLKTATDKTLPVEYELSEVSLVYKDKYNSKNVSVSLTDKKMIKWYNESLNNADYKKYIIKLEQLDSAASTSESQTTLVRYALSPFLFNTMPAHKHEKEIILSTIHGDMNLEQYRAIGSALANIWNRGKKIAIKVFDYIKLGFEKSLHLVSSLIKKYNLTLDDVIMFLDQGPYYLTTLSKIRDWRHIAKMIILNILPNIIQSVYKSDPNTSVMNSTLISQAVALIREDRKRYESDSSRQLANLISADARNVPKFNISRSY